jgi:ribonuclease HI
LGVLKINCDGAFFAETKTRGWGFVIRYHNSHAILAGSGSLGAVHDAECTEVQACGSALQAASSHGMGNIILESDSMNTVKALQLNERYLSPASVLYKEERVLISLCFDSIQVSHIPRSCNRSAHELARMSLGWDPDQPHV